MKRQVTRWERIVTKHIPDKGLVARMFNELTGQTVKWYSHVGKLMFLNEVKQ